MSAYITFYLRDNEGNGKFLEMEWFGRSAWVYKALEYEVGFETYAEFDEKIARAAAGWLGDRIEEAVDDIAANQELIDVAKEVEAPIDEKLEAISYYQAQIVDEKLEIEKLRAAKEVIARYSAIAEFSTNARVYVAHECNPNGDEED